MRGSGYLDPKAVKGRDALTRGMWDVWVPVRGLGLVRKARLGADRAPGVDDACLPALLGTPAQLTVPYFTDPHGNLTLDVDRRGKRLGDALAKREVLRMPGDSMEIELAAVSHPGTAPAARLAGAARQHPRGRLRGAARRAGTRRRPGAPAARHRPRTSATPFTRLRPGTWQLSARLDGALGPELKIGQVRVDDRGRMHPVDGLDPRRPGHRPRGRRPAPPLGQAHALLKRISGPLMRHLEPATRKRLAWRRRASTAWRARSL